MQESVYLVKNSVSTKMLYLTNNIHKIKISMVYM
jgi:hypothetical protein